MNDFPEKHFSKTLEKGLRVLRLFDQNHSSLSLKEISEATGINKSSAYSLVNTLVKLGYLTKDPQTKRLKVGPAAISLGHNLMESHDILQIVKKFINYVSTFHNISVDSFILDKGNFVRLFVSEPSGVSSMVSVTMEEAWHWAALAKALLAVLPTDERDDIIDKIQFETHTEKTIENKQDLLIDLEEIKKRGYAINNEEYAEGIVAIGAPFFNRRENRPIGAVSFDFYTSQYSLDEVEKKYAHILLDLVRDISAAIPI